MKIFCCPVCGQALTFAPKEAFCPAGHRFDRARQGYFNLLQSQASTTRRHGDDRLMVEARTRFLEQGFYKPLRQCLAEFAVQYVPAPCAVLDAGCGEGYYTEGIAAALRDAGKDPQIAAIDISRDSAKAIARRPFEKQAVVASAFRLPVLSESCDLILDIFAPCAAEEFARVLKPGGVLLRAVPLERHLFGLKAAIYEKPYENSPVEQALPGFKSIAREDLCWTLSLDSQAKIDELFKMTPYYYKTSPADQAKVAALQSLSTELAFAVLADQKE